MSNLSSYASRYLSRNPTEKSPPSSQSAVDSHFQFDPLLRSTFGHRSADLYASQSDRSTVAGDDLYNDDDEEAGGPSRNFSARTSKRKPYQSGSAIGSSSLINASRYGPSTSRRFANANDIPEIADEEDFDDDDDAEEQRAVEEAEAGWGRGINVQHFQRRTDESMSGLLDSDELDRQDTPNASLLASKQRQMSGQQQSRRLQSTVDAIDPFLVDEEDDMNGQQHKRLSAQRPSKYEDQSTDSSSVTTSTGTAAEGLIKEPPSSHPAGFKGKLRAAEPPSSPVPRGGKGWLAHSAFAQQQGRIHKSSKPIRDAYSIYDDEENEILTSEEEDADRNSDTTDDETAEAMPHRSAALASSVHHPTRISAARFADSMAASRSQALQDDFHKKLPSASAQGLSASGVAGSSTLDTYTYPVAGDPSLAGWKPWAPGNNPSWKQWKDQSALILWVFSVALTVVLAGGASLGISSPKAPSTPATRPSPYYTLTRSLPLLMLLSVISLALAVLKLTLLRNLTRLGGAQVLRYALIVTPTSLTLAWAWAFAGSFLFDDEQWSGGAWSTSGLRLLSLIPLLLVILFSRLLYVKRNGLARSLSVLSLSAKIVTTHPTLLLLSFIHIVVFLAISVPFMTIFIRLFLIGHFVSSDGERREWITDGRARLLAWATLATWLWTWAALRGIMRVVVSSVVSHWYFFGPPSEESPATKTPAFQEGVSKLRRGEREEDDASDRMDEESEIIGIGGDALPGAFDGSDSRVAAGSDIDDEQLEHRNPTASDLVRASFLRATGPSLGTILLSALLIALSRALLLISWVSRTMAAVLSSPQVPPFLHPLAHLAYLLSGAGGVIKGVSDYTLVYTGITGQGFWTSSRRCSRLIVKRGTQGIMEGLIIGTILSLLTVSLSLLAALAGFLFSAHQLHVPADAPLVGLLCGVVPYWTLRLPADVLSTGADALYLCYAIDEASASRKNQTKGTQGGSSSAPSASAPAGNQAESEETRKAFQADNHGRGSGGIWGKILPL